MDINTFSIDTNLAINTVSFLFGLLCGHWFALGRDKRQEFNRLVNPIIAELLEERRYPSSTIAISAKDEYFITHLLRIWKRGRFKRACIAYRDEKRDNVQPDGMGGYEFNPTPRMNQNVDKLLKILKPR